ncbi:unnamed protein product (macronuclear) [Paramecium tetraurelia]|uniref:Uncharacterized protein n=1 Tax=Paramecium tetraurelia TaxID=5888 RepID=A0CW45_PARTE|nr:uncharacterized protein GSPATT00001214001 [Paramecium tetraurelia]CAK75012.1 unnamed protein product [Paramecium tetraurelia]|eukprot:XP_001442409.1 hypothetical protein (macronuclear) [Paramecium tetraurelia strain d4-2]
MLIKIRPKFQNTTNQTFQNSFNASKQQICPQQEETIQDTNELGFNVYHPSNNAKNLQTQKDEQMIIVEVSIQNHHLRILRRSKSLQIQIKRPLKKLKDTLKPLKLFWKEQKIHRLKYDFLISSKTQLAEYVQNKINQINLSLHAVAMDLSSIFIWIVQRRGF